MRCQRNKKGLRFPRVFTNRCSYFAYLIDPLTNEVVQQGFAAHDIGDKVVTDQDILNYRAGVEQIPDFALNTPNYIW